MKWGRRLKISTLIQLLNAKCFTKVSTKELEHEVECAFSCDLMSDVLAYVDQEILLITGLSQIQSLRTAEMLDIKYLLFVRGKQPSDMMIEIAIKNNMTLLGTQYTMYETSGRLYQAGLVGLEV